MRRRSDECEPKPNSNAVRKSVLLVTTRLSNNGAVFDFCQKATGARQLSRSGREDKVQNVENHKFSYCAPRSGHQAPV